MYDDLKKAIVAALQEQADEGYDWSDLEDEALGAIVKAFNDVVPTPNYIDVDADVKWLGEDD